jgi:hypothetical protein
MIIMSPSFVSLLVFGQFHSYLLYSEVHKLSFHIPQSFFPFFPTEVRIAYFTLSFYAVLMSYPILYVLSL